MRLDAATSSLRGAKLTVACATVSTVSLTATPAYGLSLDEVVTTVTSSPLATFGVGCAAGAIVGGLVFGLAAASGKRRLYEELEEVSAEAQRAHNSAEAYRARYTSLKNLRNAEAARASAAYANAQPWAISQATPAPRVRPQVVQSQPAPQARHYASQAQAAPQTQAAPQPNLGDSQSITGVLPRQDVSAASAKKPARNRSSVSDTLLSRLNPNALDMPVINRGQAVQHGVTEAERFPGLAHTNAGVTRTNVPLRTATLASTNQMARTTRASIIDRRVPKFDESLFPDTTQAPVVSTGQQEQDDFESAMHAMDQILLDETANSRASKHVDDLMKEELERRNSETPRGYSRARLTVIEGSGDSRAARGSARGSGRHFAPVSREA